MTIIKKITAVLTLIVVTACGSDDNSNSDIIPDTDFNLVTGINIQSDEFSEARRLGNPNSYTNNLFVVYPNPTVDFLSVSANRIIESAWITPATALKIYQETNYNSVLDSNTYNQELIETNAVVDVLNVNSDHITINLQTLNSGYYKVFIKMDGELFWENIYVPEGGFQIEDIIDYWE